MAGAEDVIDLCSESDDDVDIVEASEDEDADAALALRLQNEEWAGGVSNGGRAAEPPGFDADDDAPDVFGRRERSEQDAAYEASLRADQEREAAATRASREAELLEAQKRAEQAAAERAEAQALADEQRAVADKAAAKERWLAVPPDSGVSIAFRFSDGSRLARKFAPHTLVSEVFECAAALGPLPLASPITFAFGFPRSTLVRGAETDRQTIAEAGLEDAVMVTVPSAE